MENNITVFAAEDDQQFTKMLEYVFQLDPEISYKIFTDGRSLLDALHKKPSIITLDYTLPDFSGEEILKRIQHHLPQTPVIIISGIEDIKTAVRLFKNGAYDFISKDEDIRQRLLNSINHLKNSIHLSREVEMLREELTEKYEFGKTIFGNSEPMVKVFNLLSKAVNTNITVSVTGETGTGKELVAKAIHFNSKRKKYAFVAINVAAIPEALIESELFGHEKGAFTGAISRRIGKFEEAQQGTLFIDEIGELDFNLQAKLLRVIQERELTRIGGNQVVNLDVKIITATHKNLAEEVKRGNFREDLYYRLLGLPIHLPPLRDRGTDILLISKHFIESFCKENGFKPISLSKEAQNKLMKYHFPGNIRELKAIVDLACVLCQQGSIEAEDIQFGELSSKIDLFDKEMTMREYTFNIVARYLNKYNHNVLLVAEKLDLGKSTIYRYIKEMEDEGFIEKGKKR